MVREKKSMIGFDPLAWLNEEASPAKTGPAKTGVRDEVSSAAAEETVAEEAATGSENSLFENVNYKIESSAAKKKLVSKNNLDSKKMITILDVSINETALLKGYKLSAEVLNEVVVNFYESLFNQYPGIKPLFENVIETSQAEKLSDALIFLFDNLNNEDKLKIELLEMGERHQKYGVLPEHYVTAAELLVSSLKNKIGRSWTKAIGAAWLKFLIAAAKTMCSAYTELSPEELSPEKAQNNGKNTVIDIMQTKTESAVEKSKIEVSKLSQPELKLQPVQDISKSLLLKNEILELINDTDEIAIHAADVKRIDGSALQLLCALFKYAGKNNLIIYWIEPTDELIQSAQALGMQHILELDQKMSEAG